jgi:hypothetical protein
MTSSVISLPETKRASRLRTRSPRIDLMSDETLLGMRFKDLNLQLENTWVQGCLDALGDEMAAKGLTIRPHAWLSDEWFSPDNTPGISAPFYLAHPRLMKLEKKKMLEVEGGNVRDCMRILRHEAGHVVQHAYALHRRRKWQQVFGKSSTPYPNFYKPNPTSKDYVHHLRRWYAQCHPDEDFAETFAVWLTPRSNWRKRYADWPALQKLLYVDELMAEIARKRPQLTHRTEVDPIDRMSLTLGEYYEKKLAHYSPESFSKVDGELERVFTGSSRCKPRPASTFIKQNREQLRAAVCRRSGEHPIALDAILDDLIDRCRKLKLRATRSDRSLRGELTALLSDRSVHSLYGSSRRQWIAV